jgi:hypothetical protein
MLRQRAGLISLARRHLPWVNTSVVSIVDVDVVHRAWDTSVRTKRAADVSLWALPCSGSGNDPDPNLLPP